MSRARHRRARGPVVQAIRIAKRLTLAQVAGHTAVSVGYLSRLEREQYVASLALTERFAIELDVPIEVFTGQVPPIATLRELLRIPPEDLAAAANMAPARLARVERGSERPHPDELAAIARRLGVDVAALCADAAEAATA